MLADLVNVQVSVSSVAPSQANFGTPLVLAFHTVGMPGRVLVYAGMQDADVGPQALPRTSGAYKALQRMFSQSPRPPLVKLGRRASAWRQRIDFAPVVLDAGYVYSLSLDGSMVTYAVAPVAASATGAAGPYALGDGATITATVNGGSPATATFHAQPASITGSSATYATLGGSPVLHIKVNGSPITITFTGSESDQASYLSTLTGQLTAAATAVNSGGQVQIHTTTRGSISSLEITAGDSPLLAALGLAVAAGPNNAGPNNVANIDAVTLAELTPILSPFVAAGATITVDGSHRPVVQTTTTGASSSLVMGGTARSALGFDNATHTGLDISTASVCTGLAAAINAAGANCTADGTSGTHVRCTAGADGDVVKYTGPALATDLSLRVTDSSTGGGAVAADLAAVRAADSDWYGLVVDAQDAATVQALAVAAETQRDVFVSDVVDFAVTDGTSTTDVAAVLKGLEVTRSFIQYNQDVGAYAAAGLLAGRLTATPGSDTWMFKSIAGARANVLGTTVEQALKAKNCNAYTLVAGLGNTEWGISPAGEYLDLVRGIDWFIATVQLREFLLFRANPKVPFTDGGIESLGNEIAAVASNASAAPYNLIVGESFVLTLPKAADASDADRLARTLNGIRFSGRLQGAIHNLTISGVLAP